MPLMAWSAHDDNRYDFATGVIVFAESAEAASVIAEKELDLDVREGENAHLRIRREEDADRFLDRAVDGVLVFYSKPGGEAYRLLGWGEEGDDECDDCGLNACGLAEHRVIDGLCIGCSERRHDEAEAEEKEVESSPAPPV